MIRQMGISPGIMNFYTLCTTVYGLNHPRNLIIDASAILFGMLNPGRQLQTIGLWFYAFARSDFVNKLVLRMTTR